MGRAVVPEGRKGEDRAAGRRPITYCLVPHELAPKLHDLLHAHFAEDPRVEVVVERRGSDRRRRGERRAVVAQDVPPAKDRRAVRNLSGRRVQERRAAQLPADTPPELPRRARRHADQLSFVKRVEPVTQEVEDADTARLVIRFQAGDQDTFNDLYARYFSRVYGYLRVALKDAHEAEDVAQQIFMSVFENLPRYERRSQPFRAWLFTIARNQAVRSLRKLGRVEPAESSEIDEIRLERELNGETEPTVSALDWITDRDLMVFVERLPVAQRQVLALSFMLDLSDREIAAILGRTGPDIRTLRHRALRFLEARLRAIGRTPYGSARQPWRRRIRKAPVLRMRRHALSP